jgi:hypothetical protein
MPKSLPRKRFVTGKDPVEQERRDQEVLRANKELAAYFKGQRTEREAKAALKIIKAFVKHRERLSPADRRPLPGIVTAEKTPAERARPAPPAPKPKKRRRGVAAKKPAVNESPVALDVAPETEDLL